MILRWLDTKEVDEFADSIVAELKERFPPTGVDLSTRKAVDRVLSSVERIGARVAEFGRGRRLNVYKKARFGNRIKWALKEAQYPELFVDVMTQELVARITLSR